MNDATETFRVFVDPGENPGYAEFEGPHLVRCSQHDGPSSCHPTGIGYVEYPSYNRHREVDPNDLIALAWDAGQRAEFLLGHGVVTSIVKVDVSWKGNLPKSLVHERMRRRLTGDETDVLDRCLIGVPKGKQHNVLDAVAMGIKVLTDLGVRK